MSIEEFANLSQYNINTVKKNLYKIPGANLEDLTVPEGSRYPYNLRNSKLKDVAERRYHLINATSKYNYIDSNMLHMTDNSFDTMVNELVERGIFQLNGSENQ